LPQNYKKKKKKKGPSKYQKVILEKERQERLQKKNNSQNGRGSTARNSNGRGAASAQQSTVSVGYLIFILAVIGGGIGIMFALNPATTDNGNGGDDGGDTNPPPSDYGFDHSCTTIDSQSINFRDYDGNKVVVLEFMTVNCPACGPMVDNLVQVYSNLGNTHLEIFTLDVGGSSISTLQQYRTTHGISHKISQNGISLSQYFTISATPSTIILDKNGNQFGDMLVGVKTVAELESLINSAMAV